MEKIAIDIETLPAGVSSRIKPKEDSPEARDTIEFLVNEKPAEDEEIKKLSLDAISAQIVAIALARFDQDSTPKESLVLYGDDEVAILREFWKAIASSTRDQFVAHNGLSFDLPFIWRRSVIQNVKPTRLFSLARYRNDPVFDTMQVWANWNSREYVSLGRLTEALALGSKSGSGAEVLGMWLAGQRDKVARYCLHDAFLAYACYCRMNFLPVPDLNEPERKCRFVEFGRVSQPSV
jgi:3'-5' exonuclease